MRWLVFGSVSACGSSEANKSASAAMASETWRSGLRGLLLSPNGSMPILSKKT